MHFVRDHCTALLFSNFRSIHPMLSPSYLEYLSHWWKFGSLTSLTLAAVTCLYGINQLHCCKIVKLRSWMFGCVFQIFFYCTILALKKYGSHWNVGQDQHFSTWKDLPLVEEIDSLNYFDFFSHICAVTLSIFLTTLLP